MCAHFTSGAHFTFPSASLICFLFCEILQDKHGKMWVFLHKALSTFRLNNSSILSWVCHIFHVVCLVNSSAWYLKRQDFLVASPADYAQVLWCVYSAVSVCVLIHQNQLVDVCEKIQLQALRIEKFINQTLTVKEQKLQVRNTTDDNLTLTLTHTQQLIVQHSILTLAALPLWKKILCQTAHALHWLIKQMFSLNVSHQSVFSCCLMI